MNINKNEENLEVRLIRESDLKAVAWLHILAFPDSGLMQFGVEALRRYYLWQLKGPHDSVCIGAFREGKLAGFCFAGVFREAETGFLRKNFLFLVWHLLTHPALLLRDIIINRINYSIQAIRTLQHKKKRIKKQSGVQNLGKGNFGILSIAVHPECQGLGIGQLIIQNVEIVARQKGFDSMRLTVHPDNRQAIIFYEKQGWLKVQAGDGIWRGFMVKDFSNNNE